MFQNANKTFASKFRCYLKYETYSRLYYFNNMENSQCFISENKRKLNAKFFYNFVTFFINLTSPIAKSGQGQ